MDCLKLRDNVTTSDRPKLNFEGVNLLSQEKVRECVVKGKATIEQAGTPDFCIFRSRIEHCMLSMAQCGIQTKDVHLLHSKNRQQRKASEK